MEDNSLYPNCCGCIHKSGNTCESLGIVENGRFDEYNCCNEWEDPTGKKYYDIPPNKRKVV